jgi:1-acyl-sn-glycerol-3-phosphate acyltransferase
VLAISINRGMIFMAKDTLFKVKWKAYFIRNFGAFPVRRERMDTKVLRHADHVLDQGLALVMFPEGGRSADYRLTPAKPGSAIIATRRNIPILPVGITGTENTEGHWWIFRRPRINVNIGPSFRLPPVKGRLDKDKLVEYSSLIMSHIAALLPPEYLGDNYAAREGK